MSNRAWVTLATNDSYGLGALVLAISLRRANSAHPAVVLITPAVTEAMRNRLSAVFAEVITVNVLDSQDSAHLALLQRPELGITFTKIHCWTLTQYQKCVFLDADTLIVQNCDELFEREELSAAPDVGWPDCFNSGVFVFVPSQDTYSRLITFAQERGSFDGGDQGLLNAFFADWARGDINKHLPFLYNVTSAAFYSYIPALKHYGQDLKIIHFIGTAKPWLQQFNWQSRSVDAPEHLRQFLQLWWDLFVGQVHSQLDTAMELAADEEQAPLELPPEKLPEDIEHHYIPEIKADSEFPWHWPQASTEETVYQIQQVDMSKIHDPWEHTRGNIPPKQEFFSQRTDFEKMQNEEEIRKYAWEYHASYNPNSWQQTQQNYSHLHQSAHNTHQDHHSQYDEHQNINQHEYYQHSGRNSQENKHFDYDLPNNLAQHSQSQQEYLHSEPKSHQVNQFDYSNNDHQNSHNNFNQTHFDESHLNNYKTDSHQHERSHNVPTSQNVSGENPQKYGLKSNVLPSMNQINSDQVYQLYLDHHPSRHNPRLRRLDCDHIVCANGFENGNASDSESEDEFIIPRHPYDGFYMRHRSTIDSRGRKICSHEIPPTPLHSPPPEEHSTRENSPVPTDYDTASECEDQYSGVAGNLARVVPGPAGYQSDAIDELTRRQGWEAGNIDYMGADSFANIWAKISQTLNQQPPKEPSPPRKEPTPPKELSPAKEQPQPEAAPEPVEQPAPPAPTAAPVADSEPLAQAPSTPPVTAEIEKPKPEVPAPDVVPAEQPKTAAQPLATESPVEQPPQKTEPEVPPTPPVTPKSTPEASSPVTEAAPEQPIAPAPTPAQPASPAMAAEAPASPAVAAEAPASPAVAAEAPASPAVAAEAPASPAVAAEAPASPAVAAEAPASPAVAAEAPASPAVAAKAPASPEPAKLAATPEKPQDSSVTTTASTDSPPLANTPSKEGAPVTSPAKSEERRKPVEKLQLSPPAAVDAAPTPDSELEDAASLAHAIIASELSTAVTAPSPAATQSPTHPLEEKRLSVEAPEVPTPPVSLAQIGVKPKGKPSTAAQIESSITEKVESVAPETPTSPAPADSPVTPTTPSTPATPSSEGKKKVVKKVTKKEASSSAETPTPVPPPRKKEKKPKEK